MFRPLITALALLLPGAALAQDCPDVPDRIDEVAALYTQLQSAPSERAARPLSDALWAIWTDAPDARAQEMLDRGMRARSSFDWDGAVAAFDELTAYCPEYAEGYNQRAFIRFIREDYGTALDDLERALDRNPTHVAAMSGQALTLMRLGRMATGQDVLRRALKLNPWLPERRLLIEPRNNEL